MPLGPVSVFLKHSQYLTASGGRPVPVLLRGVELPEVPRHVARVPGLAGAGQLDGERPRRARSPTARYSRAGWRLRNGQFLARDRRFTGRRR